MNCVRHKKNHLLLVAQYVSCKDVVLSPAGLAKHFKYKKFPKGLGVAGQMVVEVKGKNKFGNDFGELKKPTGAEWEVDWTDGTKNQLIPQPTKNLALSLQLDQEIMVNAKLMTCCLYTKKGCHLKDSSLITSPERTQSAQPRKRKTRSSSSRTAREILQPAKKKASNKQKQLKKTGTNKQKRLKKTEAKKKKNLEKSVDKNSEKNEKNPEESEPTATKDGESEHDGETTEEEDSGAPHHTGTSSATTPPTTPVKDGEKPTDTRKRKQTAQRAGAKKKWRKCRAPNLTNAQRGIVTKAFADGKLDISFIFAERTLKEYVGLQKSPLHVNARNIFAAAIGQVMCQVNPETDRPLGGNVTAVFDILFPICQKVCHS